MNEDKLWGNYSKIRLVLNSNSSIRSFRFEKSDSLWENVSLQNQVTAIAHRDSLIALCLENLQVTHLVDIGCDFGSLLNAAEERGISGLGIEISLQALDLVSEAGLLCQHGSIQDLLAMRMEVVQPITDFFANGKTTAIACLNILHSSEAARMRLDFITLALKLSDYVIVTLYRDQLIEVLDKISCTVHSYLGNNQKPIGRWKSNILQYGRPHISKNAFLDKVESQISSMIFRSRPLYPDKITNYTRLVVVIKKN